ncbi:hypothetical protein TNCV_257971 [Trichonephila clavipes]|uniref:Transposase Tc1-like domain-containing protein n=1 Tax=Trichonephila clavipes TaxID=2585209 RepID=A0A8X6RRP7_TRICX|nr:hypothetical protein TNCV_257971 [Trichonephila clavipes]
MSKLPDLDAFDRGSWSATHGSFNFRNRQTARIFKVNSMKSTINQRSGKLQRAISRGCGQCIVRRVVRSHTLAYIINQLNGGASCTVSKWTVERSLHRMGFESR